MTAPFRVAEAVANAVLYEGYVLYPYRASAMKNQLRWQFGIVTPDGYREAGGTEPSAMQTECLVESAGDTALTIRVRFLHAQSRLVEEAIDAAGGVFRPVASLEVRGAPVATWDEGVEGQIDLPMLRAAELLAREYVLPIELAGGCSVELAHDNAGTVVGRITRTREPIDGAVRIQAESVGSALRVRVRVENTTAWPFGVDGTRDHAMRRSLLGAHTLLAVNGGKFISLLEPPEWAASAAAACRNEHTWPVLIGASGARDVMLSSPIILYDYPAIAPESAGDLCDATEIDEILMLRVMTLSDEEKRAARGTDARARQIIERADTIPEELFGRLHGAIRSLGGVAPTAPAASPARAAPDRSAMERFLNGEEPAGPAEDASTEVAGVRLSRGSRVRLQPKRRADAMDMFLAGRVARVEAVNEDVDGGTYVAVTVEDDPAADLHAWYGRYFYFYPDEVEPLQDANGVMGGAAPSPTAEQVPPRAAPHVLVAGVGNIFNGDDGFGVEVIRRLAARAVPEWAKVADFGIRGMHLAYELLDGSYATTILVDATRRGEAPGTVYLIEPDLRTLGDADGAADAHGMHPLAVFQTLAQLGGVPGRVLVVGCEPATTEEAIGLSDAVAGAVDEAVLLIMDVLYRPDVARPRLSEPLSRSG